MMTENEILAAIGREITEARGYDADEIQENRRRALRYYFGRPRGDEIEGRSTVQSLDVADAVNNIMAQLSPMMKATVLEIEPSSEDDEDQAQLESDFVMHIANQSNAYQQFSNAAFDALLQSNGYIKCFVDEDTTTYIDEYNQVDELMLSEYLAPAEAGDVVSVEGNGKLEPDADGFYTFKVKHTVTTRQLRVEAIAPEYIMTAAGHLSQDIQTLRFFSEKQLISKSDLLKSGVSSSVVNELPTVDYETFVAATERQFSYDDKRSGEERSTYVVDVYDCYSHIDIDQDGIAELWHIRVAGYEASIFLDKERVSFIPYCTGTAIPMPHRLQGTSIYELLRNIQDAKTMTMRQLLDNQNVANNSRVGAVDGEVNFDDLLSSRPGGVVRMRSAGSLFPIPFNDVGMSCLNTLGYLDSVRSERGAGAIDMNSGEMQIAGTSATAAMNEYGHKEKVAAWYSRNIIESLVRGTFLLIHQSLRTYYNQDVSAKLHGKWAQTNPKQWIPRHNVRVIAGLSSAERREKRQALQQNISFQSMALQAGMDGVLVNAAKVHATLSDWLRASDLPDVESYYIDPDSDQGKAAAKQKGEKAQEQKQEMEKLAQRVIDQEQQLDKYKHDTQLQFDKWDALLSASVEEAKITGAAITQLESTAITKAGQKDAA